MHIVFYHYIYFLYRKAMQAVMQGPKCKSSSGQPSTLGNHISFGDATQQSACYVLSYVGNVTDRRTQLNYNFSVGA